MPATIRVFCWMAIMLLGVHNVTDNVVYTDVNVSFADGIGSVPVTISSEGTKNLLIVINGITYDGEGLTKELDGVTIVSDDLSTFTLTDPGVCKAGVPFNLGITDAKDKSGALLNGNRLVTLTRGNDIVYSGALSFSSGTASINDIVSFESGDLNFTVSIDWITEPIDIIIRINPDIRITDGTGRVMEAGVVYVFPYLTEGYSQLQADEIAATFTISLMGSTEINDLNIIAPAGFSFTNLTSQNLSPSSPSATFMITPLTGTTAGVIDGTLEVAGFIDGIEMIIKTFYVEFEVFGKAELDVIEVEVFGDLYVFNGDIIDYYNKEQNLVFLIINTGSTDYTKFSYHITGPDVDKFEYYAEIINPLPPFTEEDFLSILYNGDGKPGVYSIIVTFTADQGLSFTFTVRLTIVSEEVIITLNPADNQYFGLMSAGYNPAPLSRTISFTNEGAALQNWEITAGDGTQFEVSPTGGSDLASGATVDFTVTPVAGHPNGSLLNEKIIVTGRIDTKEAEKELDAVFVVDRLNWAGSINSSWNIAENWQPENFEWTSVITPVVPSHHIDVVIPDVGSISNRYPLIDNQTIRMRNITINNGAHLTISPTGRLITDGMIDSDHPDKLIIQSSLSSSGAVMLNPANNNVQATVQRYMRDSYQNMVSAPVSGQNISSFLTDNNNSILYSSSHNIYAFNRFNEAVNDWYGWGQNTGGDFQTGSSYMLMRSGDGPVSFRGLLVNSASVALTRNGLRRNAVGNPFATSLNVADFINVNFDKLDDNFKALYVFDYSQPAGSRYQTVNLISGPQNLASGQGFFVLAMDEGVTTSVDIDFLPSMRRHTPAMFMKSMEVDADEDYEQQMNWMKLNLSVSKGTDRAQTLVAFHDFMTLGLDPGYDAGAFSTQTDLRLFTRMPEEGTTLNLSVQALPAEDIADYLVPVGVYNKVASEIIFSGSLEDSPAALPHFFMMQKIIIMLIFVLVHIPYWQEDLNLRPDVSS
jgi:hypothetical protein